MRPDLREGVLCAEFAAALDDDLGVPSALAAVHNVVRDGNTALANGDTAVVRGALAAVLAMTDVLGLNPLRWRAGAPADLTPTVDALVHVALQQRAAARKRRDYSAADSIRAELAAAGVLVEDTPDGPRWTLKDA